MAETLSKRNETLPVLGIFVFSVIYRVLILQNGGYPPGPDVGLHNSIINSIVLKNGNFVWNHYHMGGGPSLTHPGFHIFVAYVWLFTGMPAYIAQCMVAVLFSSLIVLCAFLLTRSFWKLPVASITAAFLGALSRYDIEMVSWGGYPNVVTLAIIPLIFYMFIREALTRKTSLLTSSLLMGTLFITHSLSAFTFICIAIPFLTLHFIVSGKSPVERRICSTLFASIILGVLIVSPFIVHVFPVYMENVGRGMLTGAISDNQRAILLTRVVPLYMVFLALVPSFLFLVFAKKRRGAFLDKVGILFGLWLFVPALLTQFFRVGLYTDYLRFLHFLIFPLTVFFALLTDYTCSLMAEATAALIHARGFPVNKKKLNSLFMVVALTFYTLGFIPFFSSPEGGFTIADYYKVTYPQEFESIEWIREKTPEDALFISNHGYGWWVSGFGHRATLTSTEPQFLMIPHEFNACYIARTLLKTNFVLNNGFIEIADDGGYVGRYNPMLSINCSKFLEPYPMVYLNESNVIIFHKVDGNLKAVAVTAVPVKSLTFEKREESACVHITRENAQLRIMRRVEILKDTRFAIIRMSVESLSSEASIQHVRILLQARGAIYQLEQTVGFLDENIGVLAQVIFEDKQPLVNVIKAYNANYLELFYNSEDTGKIEIKIIVGGFEIEKFESEHIKSLLAYMACSWRNKEPSNMSIKTFDYREVIRLNRITFIAFQRETYPIERFTNDPMFNLVYINDRVAIFKVREQNG